MSVEQQRIEIIEELQHVSDEWILKAVARLLGLDEPVPEEHQRTLDSRIDAYSRGEARTVPLDEARKRFL